MREPKTMNKKNCTPANCPHAALIEKARAACLACTCGGEPAGHGGLVSADAAGEAIISRQRVYIDRSPRGTVTKLPPMVEEKTAELYRMWCQLDTVDALLSLHVCNGGTTNNFGDYLLRVRNAIDTLQPARASFRATAWARFKGLLRRFSGFDKIRSWNDGHGGAIRREREATACDLFESVGVRI